MCKISYIAIIIFILFSSTQSFSQKREAPTSKSITESTQGKRQRYDATKYIDTLIVNSKIITATKKDIKNNYSKYTKNANNDTVIYNGDTLTVKKGRQLVVKNHRDSIRANKNVWASVLGGPSYTPEASLGLGGAVLMTFKVNTKDSIAKRSTLPFGFLASINGTFMLAGRGELYFNSNKLQINPEYAVRYEPVNYFGVGFDNIDKNYKSDSTTLYKSFNAKFKPVLSFKVGKNILLGPLIDYSYYNLSDINPVMAKDSHYLENGNEYLVAGVGLNFRYDSRDNITMPYDGVRFNFSSAVYGKWLGGSSNYTYTSINYRQYMRLFNRRSLLAWTAQVDFTTGDVPFTELPSFGSPFDLRGYAKGHYRDKSMGYAMAEYRHMFGSTEVYNHRRPFYSRLGVAVWGGVGSIGSHVWEWDQAKWNYGIGLRYEIQPNTNFRLDIGKSPEGKTMVYMNMTEAF